MLRSSWTSDLDSRQDGRAARNWSIQQAKRPYLSAFDVYPEQGDLITGSGGIRKVRLKLPTRGKSGGAKVIYFWIRRADRIYMLLAYPKAVRTDLTASQVKMLRDLVKELR